MAFGEKVPDKMLLKNVERKVSRRVTGRTKVTVAVRSGTVTLTGILGFEHERRPLMSTINSVPGVLRVADQLRLFEKPKNQ